jgi:2-polyprenyl-3-methyl-5-hydroxy-6-metoxy-1,4-benzoquinol methylase
VTYDLTLFERLNEEYRDRPIYPQRVQQAREQGAPPETPEQRAERETVAAGKRLTTILQDVEPAGKVVLEVGCGEGWLTAILPEQAGVARAIGIDARPAPVWEQRTDPRIAYVATDLAEERVFPPGSIDVALFQGLLPHPLPVLAALFDLLKDGGAVWLRLNLFAARNASYRYREVFFPWPHLLFDDAVCEQFYEKHHGRAGQGFARVNRMTAAHFVQAAREIGYGIALLRRQVAPIDVPLYVRFVDRLGRHPALDLETDYLTLVLRKGGGPAEGVAPLDYAGRQRALDRAVDDHKRAERKRMSGQPIAPANVNTPAYWDGVYGREWQAGQEGLGRDYGPMHDAVVALIPDGSEVLDVGCGSGVLCRKIKERLPGTSVMGVDFSAYTIERNREADREVGIEYACLDVQTGLPAIGRRFDAVTMCEVLEHLDRPEQAIADAMALLRVGGRFILTCPHDDEVPHAEHVRMWGHDEVYHLLAEYGEAVTFVRLPRPRHKWMLAHVTKARSVAEELGLATG